MKLIVLLAVFVTSQSTGLWGSHGGLELEHEEDKTRPYDLVFQDKYRWVTCAEDSLYSGKYEREISKHTRFTFNISIVHYAQTVPKEDQQLMTPEVCFQFCRTLEGVHFFGIVNGRNCYCSPFFESMAGDRSICDSACEGDPSLICGGETKSTIFTMYACHDTSKALRALATSTQDLALNSSAIGSESVALGQGMQRTAAHFQNLFGMAGDPVAADLMQHAKVSAGRLEYAGQATLESAEVAWRESNKGFAMLNYDFTRSSPLRAAEQQTQQIQHAATKAEMTMMVSDKMNDLTKRGKHNNDRRSHQYYPIMYFVDREWVNAPTTCGGDIDEHPLYGVTQEECAAACDFEVVKPECVGYSYYDGGLCFLFREFTSVKYWTKCPRRPGALVQAYPSRSDKFLAKQAITSMRMSVASPGCKLPRGTLEHSLITFGDAHVAAHNVYTKVTVGGNLYDDSSGTWHAINGKVTVGGTIEKGRWNFNGGSQEGVPLSDTFDWDEFKHLASIAESGIYPGAPSHGGASNTDFKVVVLRHGGSFHLFDFRGPDAQAYDHGTTLVIFNTNDDVVLEATPDARQFGPSVIAPFSKVTLRGSAGFIDGFLVAKELGPSGPNGGNLQMHGTSYAGPIDCREDPTTTVAKSTTDTMTTVSSTMSTTTPELPVTSATTSSRTPTTATTVPVSSTKSTTTPELPATSATTSSSNMLTTVTTVPTSSMKSTTTPELPMTSVTTSSSNRLTTDTTVPVSSTMSSTTSLFLVTSTTTTSTSTTTSTTRLVQTIMSTTTLIQTLKPSTSRVSTTRATTSRTTTSETTITTVGMPLPPTPTLQPVMGGLTGCFVKLEDFENTNISPAQSYAKIGRCKNCLVEAEEARRCFAGGFETPWERPN